jgi:hypothetical protein
MKLVDYVRNFFQYHLAPVFQKRLTEFLRITGAEVETILSSEIRGAFEAQIRKSSVILTGDHHGFLCHPVLVNGDLLFALSHQHGIVPVLAFGNVPLNNATYPRGLLLTEMRETRKPVRLPFFPDKSKHRLVYATRSFDKKALDRGQDRVQSQDWSVVALQKRLFLIEVLQEMQKIPELFSQEWLSQQTTLINAFLWKKFFTNPRTQLVSLQVEDIVRKWLEKNLQDHDLPVVSLLLDTSWRQAAASLFDGIPGAWNAQTGQGTRYFWGIDQKGCQLPLMERNGVLIGKNLHIELSQKALTDALAARKILPSMLISFSVLAFHFGLKCYGGFMQVDYLSRMKQAWIQLLNLKSCHTEAEATATVPTANYATGLTVSFVKRSEGIIPAGSFDIIETGGLSPEYLQKIGQKTVSDINCPGLPYIYKIIYGADADLELSQVTTREILDETGLTDLVI